MKRSTKPLAVAYITFVVYFLVGTPLLEGFGLTFVAALGIYAFMFIIPALALRKSRMDERDFKMTISDKQLY